MKLDRVDLDHLDQVTRSRGYQILTDHYTALYEAKVKELVQPSDAETTARLRGFLEGMAACQRAPRAIAAMAKGDSKYGRGRK